jgi:hypothetical protein
MSESRGGSRDAIWCWSAGAGRLDMLWLFRRTGSQSGLSKRLLVSFARLLAQGLLLVRVVS